MSVACHVNFYYADGTVISTAEPFRTETDDLGAYTATLANVSGASYATTLAANNTVTVASFDGQWADDNYYHGFDPMAG